EGPIVLSLELMPEAVLLGVSDQGSGIAPDLREKALSRFGRLDEARGGWGAGLGLALVQAVAHLHGGTVILEDGPGGKGLRVTLRLPLAKAVS
ncbi:MAG: ATP-binding protein, partial [Novosphingobium sp.]